MLAKLRLAPNVSDSAAEWLFAKEEHEPHYERFTTQRDLSAAELAETAKAGANTEVLDLTDRAAATAWIAQIEHTTGAVDVVVNNAGGVAGQEMRPIEEVPDADSDRIFAVNTGAAFALSRAVAAGMKQAGTGGIINISSGSGLGPSLTGIQAYC
jgi:3-oxoacyl-[acyl-carrier protein] reductase